MERENEKTSYLAPHIWYGYSNKLKKVILHPKHAGKFAPNLLKIDGLRFVKAHQSLEDRENIFCDLYVLIDEESKKVIGAKFQAIGPSALIGALETACGLISNKTASEMAHIGADQIDQFLQDTPKKEAFPKECYPILNLVIFALDEIIEQVRDLISYDVKASFPISSDQTSIEGFANLSKAEKMNILQQVLDKEVGPYIAMDGGGVDVVDVKENKVFINYTGACIGCASASTTTLTAIQKVLQNQVDKDLVVIPANLTI